MANKMLIDAAHPEETRVVVLRGNRVEEFDFESAHRKQLRGNIYLAKVTRVEPSLQAAFVDYGGNRHGFLAFSEIHPDYYQIPIADRQALIDEEERAQRDAEDEADRRSRRHHRGGRGGHRRSAASRDDETVRGELADAPGDSVEADETAAAALGDEDSAPEPQADGVAELVEDAGAELQPEEPAQPVAGEASAGVAEPLEASAFETVEAADSSTVPSEGSGADGAAEIEETAAAPDSEENGARALVESEGGEEDAEEDEAGEEIVESVGGADALEEVPDRAQRYRRQYKIQEVIKRRQVMLVQVVKEERGTKGAALTTYLSLAGRYSVLMPNTARGGGISRKITSAEDRSRLKEIAQELEVPEGMGVILRTAGAARTKTEIKRDFEYLLRLWETVRDLTLKSTAAKLVYEEGSLVKRSIRDLYGKDIDEVVVAGSDAYQEAKDFMRMLMPSHAKNVKLYSDTQPLLSRYGVESQLDGMFSPVVQLRSGGYVVLNQAEALVAIDVNSGRATREHHIEDTALKTNLEAADEIARQLRLRDLAGLIVIDFIDMDEKRNNRAVERRLKECLKQDRARIQVGRISHFGLLEMSRQRIRTSVLESSTEKCPYCGGSGHVRSVSSLALQVLRALEEQLMKGPTHNLVARTRPDVALYVLNQKRAHLRSLEERFAITITIAADETVTAPQAFAIERGEQVHTLEAARARIERTEAQAPATLLEEEDDLEEAGALEGDEAESAMVADTGTEQGEGGGRRRRRRRRRGRNGGGEAPLPAHPHGQEDTAEDLHAAPAEAADERAENGELVEEGGEFAAEERGEAARDGERRRRRRGRRGGRRNRHDREGEAATASEQRPRREQHFSPLGESPPPTVSETEPDGVVEDFGAEPAEPAAPAAAAPQEVSESMNADATAASSSETTTASAPEPVQQQELPRRRSTVREPAPGAGSNVVPTPTPAEPVPPPEQPSAAEPAESETTGRPRRTGWWSRRIAGG
jgi:ribonuclease E